MTYKRGVEEMPGASEVPSTCPRLRDAFGDAIGPPRPAACLLTNQACNSMYRSMMTNNNQHKNKKN